MCVRMKLAFGDFEIKVTYLEWPQNHAQVRHIPENGNGHDVAANDAQCHGLSVSWMLQVSRDERLVLGFMAGEQVGGAFKRLLPWRHFGKILVLMMTTTTTTTLGGGFFFFVLL